MCFVQELSATQGDVTKFKQRAMALETQLAVASQRVNVVEGELELAKQEVAAERAFRKTVQVGVVGPGTLSIRAVRCGLAGAERVGCGPRARYGKGLSRSITIPVLVALAMAR